MVAFCRFISTSRGPFYTRGFLFLWRITECCWPSADAVCFHSPLRPAMSQVPDAAFRSVSPSGPSVTVLQELFWGYSTLLALLLLISLMREAATVCLKSRCQKYFLLPSFLSNVLGKNLLEMVLFFSFCSSPGSRVGPASVLALPHICRVGLDHCLPHPVPVQPHMVHGARLPSPFRILDLAWALASRQHPRCYLDQWEALVHPLRCSRVHIGSLATSVSA